MNYLVPPGLYAIGSPTPADPVLVTANYKMSYDIVRSVLAGRNVWLLVLETYGINVWCAAGEGTFGTEELVRRITVSGLARAVTQRRLVLPILGAPVAIEAGGSQIDYLCHCRPSVGDWDGDGDWDVLVRKARGLVDSLQGL